MNTGRRGLRIVRSRAWVLLVVLGTLAGLAGPALGAEGRRWSLVAAGVSIAVGLLQQLALFVLARYRGRPEEFRIQLRMALALGVAVGVWYALQRPTQLAAATALVVLLLAVVLLNRSAHESGLPVLLAAHLPGAPAGPPPRNRWHPGWLAAGLLVLLVLAFVAATFDLPGHYLDVVVLLLAAVLGAAGASQRRLRAYQGGIRQALRELAPAWAMPYNGAATFHLGMWAPYLQRTGMPLMVVTTATRTFDRVSAAYDLPVVCAPAGGPAALASLFPPSVCAAFYVFNGSNGVFLNVRGVRHVFLQHGDSDKAGSANPFSLRYDNIVVAGQAGIDRFAASGLEVPTDRFVPIGRPQTEGIERSTRPIGSVAAPVVLYAPTWKGKVEATNYSSLLLGPRIVRALLRRGAVVVFRPHPAGRHHKPHVKAIAKIQAILAADAARTGRPHRWGAAAEGLSVAEVTNTSDALIADVSGIVTDYLASGKPIAMVATRNSPEEFRRLFPTSQAAYVIDSDLAGLDATLAQLLGSDPLAALRAERRSYYLGERDGREAAAAFVAWVRSLASSPPPLSAGPESRADAVESAVQHR